HSNCSGNTNGSDNSSRSAVCKSSARQCFSTSAEGTSEGQESDTGKASGCPSTHSSGDPAASSTEPGTAIAIRSRRWISGDSQHGGKQDRRDDNGAATIDRGGNPPADGRSRSPDSERRVALYGRRTGGRYRRSDD